MRSAAASSIAAPACTSTTPPGAITSSSAVRPRARRPGDTRMRRPSSTASSASKPKLDKTITLTPGEPESKATGVTYVLSEGNKRAFYVAAQGLPPSSGFFYAVWLYNSQSNSKPLGKAPTVSIPKATAGPMDHDLRRPGGKVQGGPDLVRREPQVGDHGDGGGVAL